MKIAFRLTTAVLLCFALVLCLTGCRSETPETTGNNVIVFAAASTTNAVTDIAAAFTEQTGIEVVTNFASSSTLAQQIETGAEADVYISANQKWGNYLEEKQFCQSRKTILSNRIVIIVPSNSALTTQSPQVLLQEDVKTIAMGDPTHVPVGKYGKEALEKLSLWETVNPKVTAAKDVRSALAYVETQAAEAGIVYSTDAAISDKIKILYQFPESATAKPISYPAMTLKQSPSPEAGQKFFEFLESDTAKNIFKNYGFITD